ncbi:tetratricopeptide repeat protein [Streptomyces sp. NPDC059166]|uniref:tetratricopeptide repeat protein n=1 Tax=Streptomyces sp. NPDC059166 TaxID=3346752 RepID=UPI00368238DE
MNRRHERTGFVGRRGELAVFRETFARDPEETDFPFLFHVRGNAGVGKSTLVRQWETAALEQPSVITAFVGDEVHDAVEAMEAVSDRLGRQGHPLKRFDKQLAIYRQRRHQAESAVPAPPPVSPGDPGDQGAEPAPPASPSSTVAAQVGLVGLGMVPGIGAFVGAVDPQQVALGADRVRAALNTRLRSHDDVQLVMRPLSVLAPVFLEDLAEAAERCRRVVLFFDVYERTAPVLDAWLRDIVFGDEYGGLPVNVQVVLSGQLRLDARTWGDHLGRITEVHLDVFSEEEARTLLAGHGVVDEAGVELVLRLSGRLPLLVDMLARSEARTGDGFADPSETAVERFLKWESLPERREAALACALPLQLDEDIYRAIAPDGATDGYPWLRGLAFVSTRSGRCRYHEVVRTAMLRLQRGRSPIGWQRAHLRLAEVFERWRLAAGTGLGQEAADDAPERWEDAVWREHLLNETYHRLCANHRTALPDALHQAVRAVDHDLVTFRRWAQILGQAGQDTGSTALASLGRRLEAAGEHGEATVDAIGLLLAAPELGPAGRALAYVVRGWKHRVTGAHADALADYEAAVALDPEASRAHTGLGETYRLMRRHEEAVAACTRAVELDPLDRFAFGSRGDAYRNLGRYDEALADFARAVGLDPGYAWAFGSRALVHEALGHPGEAVADYTRAVEIDPEYAWAFGSRAFVQANTGPDEEALADYSRAIEINPRYSWALVGRARLHHRRGDHGEALADFARALAAEPDHGWALVNRAETFRELGRHEEALADLTRAVTLDPGNEFAVACRGALHHHLGRYEEALSDHSSALGIDPRYLMSLLGRSMAYRRLGRYDEAAADLTVAIEIDPGSVWRVAHRAEAYRRAGRYEEATNDYRRVMEGGEPEAWSFAGRAQLHLRTGRFQEALDDCARAVDLGPDDGWYLSLNALSLRLDGDERESRSCFARAITLLLDAGADGGLDQDLMRGCLLFVHCALQEDESAIAQCDALVRPGVPEYAIREAYEDLSLLRDVLPDARPTADPLLRRLGAVLGGGSAASGTWHFPDGRAG